MRKIFNIWWKTYCAQRKISKINHSLNRARSCMPLTGNAEENDWQRKERKRRKGGAGSELFICLSSNTSLATSFSLLPVCSPSIFWSQRNVTHPQCGGSVCVSVCAGVCARFIWGSVCAFVYLSSFSVCLLCGSSRRGAGEACVWNDRQPVSPFLHVAPPLTHLHAYFMKLDHSCR